MFLRNGVEVPNIVKSLMSKENVIITNEMHNFYNQFLFHNFCLLYMFRTNLVVHHQEHGNMYCITQFVRIMQASLAAL